METSPSNVVQTLSRQGWRGKLKIAAYCLLPAVTLICVAESTIRLGGYDAPLAGTIFFDNLGLNDPLHRTDSQLFYSLRPNTHIPWQGAMVSTNSLGLRSDEIGPKQANEFRILSLGESSTFGARVGDDETYSAQLEHILNENSNGHLFRVINAGVSGYTSFQSLKYLETRGLQLQGDLVLFYHEINDAQLSNFSDNELYESHTQAWHRRFADWSAIYRLLSNTQARRKIQAQRAEDSAEGTTRQCSRVSPEERRENFQRLREICEANQITLVMIHPTYAGSQPHSCELTEFCEQTQTPMYDAIDALHPAGEETRAYFADEVHPNPEGHARLARGLFEFLRAADLVP